ncbi:hypothetical protein VTO42DRAFT_7247 [Malbranchea cinnamomea]
MGERGKPPQVATVREMANILLANRGEFTAPPTVGVNWVTGFMKRNGLESKFSRKYDYKRAPGEDPKVIREWFQLVQNTIEKYGIPPEDIYPRISTTLMRTSVQISYNLDIENGSVIEGVNACGWFLPPMFILKGKNHQASWYQTEGLPDRGIIGLSENGGSLLPQYSDAYTNPSGDFS